MQGSNTGRMASRGVDTLPWESGEPSRVCMCGCTRARIDLGQFQGSGTEQTPDSWLGFGNAEERMPAPSFTQGLAHGDAQEMLDNQLPDPYTSSSLLWFPQAIIWYLQKLILGAGWQKAIQTDTIHHFVGALF